MPTALIVDDEHATNSLIAMLIRARGYERHSAYTAAEVDPILASNPVDVVLLDLMLPDRDGLEVCGKLARSPDTCSIPIVIASARLAERSRIESLRAGACEFLAKPFLPDQLFAALGSAERWKAEAQASPLAGRVDVNGTQAAMLQGITLLRCKSLRAGARSVISIDRLAELLETQGPSGASALFQAPAAYTIAFPWIQLDLTPSPGIRGLDEWTAQACDRLHAGQAEKCGDRLRIAWRLEGE